MLATAFSLARVAANQTFEPLMVLVYDFKADERRIRLMQQATPGATDFGVSPEPGLVGTPAWWRAIVDGRLESVTTSMVSSWRCGPPNAGRGPLTTGRAQPAAGAAATGVADELDDEGAFARLVLHPALRPMRMDDRWLDPFSSLQKKHWVEFAKRLEAFFHAGGSIAAVLEPEGSADVRMRRLLTSPGPHLRGSAQQGPDGATGCRHRYPC
jgi:hypothetical protein